MEFIVPGGVNTQSVEIKIAAFRIQNSRFLKRFDYWTNLSYPFHFYFVIFSEQNILYEFQIELCDELRSRQTLYCGKLRCAI